MQPRWLNQSNCGANNFHLFQICLPDVKCRCQTVKYDATEQLQFFRGELCEYCLLRESKYDGIRNTFLNVDNALLPDLTSEKKQLSRNFMWQLVTNNLLHKSARLTAEYMSSLITYPELSDKIVNYLIYPATHAYIWTMDFLPLLYWNETTRQAGCGARSSVERVNALITFDYSDNSRTATNISQSYSV